MQMAIYPPKKKRTWLLHFYYKPRLIVT